MWNGSACERFEVQTFRSISHFQTGNGAIQGRNGGQWSPLTHIRCYGLNTAPMFMRFLAFGIKPSSALEMGCGLGTTADFVARFTPGGARVTCLEPEVMLEEVFGRRALPWRPTQLAVNIFDEAGAACRAFINSQKFELVYTLEVAEHISPHARPTFVQLLSTITSRLLVFSAARPSQGGTGHVRGSMLHKRQWIELFEQQGMVLLPNVSAFASRLAHPERAFDIAPNVFVMRARDVWVNEDALLHQAGRVLDRSLTFGAKVPEPPLWRPTHAGTDPNWRGAIDAAKPAQKIYEAALWPELATLAARGSERC